MKILSVMVGALASAVAFAGDLPNRSMTPGATNPDVTQANIQSTICVKGYTKRIRPPAYFTNKLKKEQINQYGYGDKNPKDYEEDHLIALSIGGAPQDEHNLWPQPRDSQWNASKKDQLEFVLYKMVCANEVSLEGAQHAMATNWVDAWKTYVPTHSSYKFKSVD
jgi:hypothetical protein